MKTFCISPHPALYPFVDRLWGWEGATDEFIELPTLLPGTGAELYFHYREPFQYALDQHRQADCGVSHLFCVRGKPLQLSPSANIGFIAVRFKIGMLHRFTEIPGNELADNILSTDQIWGVSGSDLPRHLSYASGSGERLSLIQSFLMRHLRGESLDPLIEKAMPILYRQCSSISVRSLAENLNIGRRQFERRFLAFSGQTPSGVKCLSRLQRTVRALMLDVSANPRTVALSNGYYDQAHFIHDFQRLAGCPPHQYLADARAKTHFYNTSRRAEGILCAPIMCKSTGV